MKSIVVLAGACAALGLGVAGIPSFSAPSQPMAAANVAPTEKVLERWLAAALALGDENEITSHLFGSLDDGSWQKIAPTAKAEGLSREEFRRAGLAILEAYVENAGAEAARNPIAAQLAEAGEPADLAVRPPPAGPIADDVVTPRSSTARRVYVNHREAIDVLVARFAAQGTEKR